MCEIREVCSFFTVCQTSRGARPHPVRHSPVFSSVSLWVEQANNSALLQPTQRDNYVRKGCCCC